MQIEDTVRAIRAAEVERLRRIAEKRGRERPVVKLDAILEELERMHLRGNIKVSVEMMARIERFLEEIPEEFRHEFPLRTTITRVMDNLYLILDRLLSHKDMSREHFRRLDQDLEERGRDDYSAA
ncbi:MAG TPA: hypothetical protein VGR61_06785 [Candidatus Dormibacteraeota bacterium]|nr:hypothetical protein [Candidatus Dormibacteraeota bacterium]